MIAKQVWRAFSNLGSKIACVLKCRYFPNGSILNAEVRSTSSYFYKGFVWGMELLKKGLKTNLGSGASIRMFKDPWLPRPTSFKVISPNFDMDNSLIQDFMTPSL